MEKKKQGVPTPVWVTGALLAFAVVGSTFGGSENQRSVTDTNEPYIRDESGVEGLTAEQIQKAELLLAEKRAASEMAEQEKKADGFKNPEPVAEPAREQAPVVQREESSCHPSYSGCLDINASDYDCAGGTGNGPKYTGPVRVVGPDVFDLDRDGNGQGCEKK